MKRKILPLLLAVVLVVAAMVPMFAISAAADEKTATVKVVANTGKLSDKVITWTSGNVTISNAQDKSTTAIRTSDSDHYRIYAKSKLKVSVTSATIDKVVFTCTGPSYATAMKNSAAENADYAVTVSGSTVTVTNKNSTDAIEFSATEQIRIKEVEVTYTVASTTCDHTNTKTVTTPASCTVEGSTVITCNDCGEPISKVTTPMLPHNYVDGVCSACEKAEPAGYVLVTNVSELKDGDQIIIVAKDSNYALSTNQKTNNRGQVAVTKEDNVVSFEEDAGVQIITLEAGTTDGTYAFNVGNGFLYAASSSSNHLKTQTTNNANGIFTITIDDGVATIKATGSNERNWLRYNETDLLFSCYASGQKDVAIYKLPVEGACAHESKTLVEDASKTFASTCTVAGQNTYVCDDCREELVENLPKITHVVVNGACTSGCGVTVEEFFGQVSTEGTTLDGTYTLTGVITGFYASGNSTGEYDATYENVSVIIDIDGTDTNFVCYRMKGTGADVIKVGDTITATGTITNYKGTIEFTQDCTLDSYVPAPVTEFDAASMLISNDLTLNYIVKAPADVIDTLTVKFEFNGETYTVVGKPLEDGRVQFSLVGIAPQQIKLNVKAELYADEELVDKVAEYSIAKYIERTLANNPTAELKALLESVTAYSKAADNYLAGTPGAITEETAPEINSFAGEKPTDENNRIYAGGVRFDYLNSIYVKVKAENAGNIAVFDSEGEKIKYDVLPYADGYIVYVQVKPTEFNKVFTFTVGTKHSVTYSVNSYIYAMWNNAEVGELARATYNFGVAANAYKVANEDAFVKNN